MSAMIYLLQVSACMGLFYLFYYFRLSRLTFFTINRWYLLATLILSFVIPVLTIHVQDSQYVPVIQQARTIYEIKAPANLSGQIQQAVVEKSIDWIPILKLIYCLVAAALFIHLVITVLAFFTKLRNKKVDRIGRVNVMHGNNQLSNGSFLNYIFLNDDELSADEMQQIIAHEMLHVKLLHSADRIVAKIIQIILWFNPFVYLYLRSIEENHEFEVDRKITLSTDKNNYAELLLHLSIAKQGMLYHNFSKVPLKNRITMLFNKPSANMKRIIYLGIIPLIVLSCAAFARLKNDEQTKKQYSVVGGINELGKDPLVLIDDKPYPSTILYKISESCVGGSSIMTPAVAIKYRGAIAKDGLVNIRTKNGKITLMTPSEKQILIENTDKEDAVPATSFYNRLTLKKYNGEKYSKIIMRPPGGGRLSTKIGLEDKAAYLFDGKLYDENSIQTLSPTTIAAIKGEYSVEGNRAYWPRLKDYTAIFTFTTKVEDSQKTTIDNGVGNNGGQQLKATAGKGYSEINGVELLGKNPLVIIDGKEYPADLLYKISKSCVKSETVFPGDVGIKIYGSKARDGYAEINTKNGKIVYIGH